MKVLGPSSQRQILIYCFNIEYSRTIKCSDTNWDKHGEPHKASPIPDTLSLTAINVVMSSPKHTAPLALPAPDASSSNDPSVTTLEVGGKTISFDKLGPMVVNSDGTLSRIANWQEMTPAEQRNTIRVLSKRNQLRTATISQQIAGTQRDSDDHPNEE